MAYLREISTAIVSGLIISGYITIRYLQMPLSELDILVIGVLIGSIFPILQFGWGSRIKKLVMKPRLDFRAEIESDAFKRKKQDKKESERITFWVHIRNAGNEIAETCRIRLKITDLSGMKKVVEKTTHPTIDEDIPISWLIAGKEQESRDIAPSNYFDSMFKIPFVMEFYHEESVYPINEASMSMYFEDPVKKPFNWSYITHLGNRNIMFGLLCEVIITSNTGEIARKKIQLKIEPDKVLFEPIE